MTNEELDVDAAIKEAASRWQKLWANYIAKIEAADRELKKAIARRERTRTEKAERQQALKARKRK